MTSINSNYNAAATATTRPGIGGLVSGMDTDSLVESMTGNITDKINALKQQQQTLSWQQAAYQTIIDSLVSFNDKYLSSSSPLSSADFFQNATISALGSNSGAVSASGIASAIKDMVIQSVGKLATTAGITTNKGSSVSTQEVSTGNIDLVDPRTVSAMEGQSLTFSYGNKKYTVTLDEVKLSQSSDPAVAAEENANNTMEALNKALGSAGLGDVVNAKLVDGRVTMEQKGTAGSTLKLEGGGKAIMDAFGLTAGQEAKDGEAISGRLDVTAENSGLTKEVTFAESIALGEGKFTLNLDGKNAEVDLKAILAGVPQGSQLDMKTLVEGINGQLEKQFGKDTSGNRKVEVTFGDGTSDGLGQTTGQLSFKTSSTNSILSVATGDAGVLGKSGAMNLQFGAANRMQMYESLDSSAFNLNGTSGEGLDFSNGNYGFKINDVAFEIGKDFITIDGKKTEYKGGVTMNTLMNAVNSSEAGVTMKYLSTTDRFSVTAKESGAMGKVAIQAWNRPADPSDPAVGEIKDMSAMLFGGATADANGDPIVGANGKGVTFDGEFKGGDAQMTVSFDGGNTFETVERSSNIFKLDGVEFTLNSTFEAKHDVTDASGNVSSVGSGDAIKFTAKTNTEEITKKVKEMVEDYNKLIESINKEVTTKHDRGYKPLTDAQKKEMSEDDIKNWNEKCQEGLLFGDHLLRAMASELRFAFSLPISGSSFNNIGISTSTDYSENGKLVFNEAKFKSALEGNPDEVSKLFTSTAETYNGEKTQKGAMASITDIIKKYASTTGATKGALVEKAGYKGSALSISNSTMYKQMKTLNNQIDVWTDRLESARDRYYKQFTNMEVYLSKMNSQASFFQGQG